MASLWEALGRPPPATALPGPRAPGWVCARAALLAALAGAAGGARLRSAGTLWRALAGTAPPPRGARWRYAAYGACACEGIGMAVCGLWRRTSSVLSSGRRL